MNSSEVATGTREGLLRIGELARRCKKSVRALHLYEDLGLLQPTSRSKGRFRLYDVSAVDRVQWIGKLQAMGFSLTQIQSFLQSWVELKTAPAAMRQIRKMFAERLQEIEETLRKLTGLSGELAESLTYLEKCHTCTLASSQCDQCGPGPVPRLVAEFHGTIRPPASSSDGAGDKAGGNGAAARPPTQGVAVPPARPAAPAPAPPRAATPPAAPPRTATPQSQAPARAPAQPNAARAPAPPAARPAPVGKPPVGRVPTRVTAVSGGRR